MKKTGHNYEQRLRELTALNDLGRDINSSLSPNQVISSAYGHILSTIAPDLAVIFLLDEDRLISQGEKPENQIFKQESPDIKCVGQCLCGLVAVERKPIYSLDIHADPRCTLNECKKTGLRSFAAVPLIVNGDVQGVLGVGSLMKRDFSQQAAFLETFSNQIAIAIKNAALHEQLKNYSEQLKQNLIEFKRSEEEKYRARKDWGDIFQAIGHPTLILDVNHNILMANTAAERLTGMSQADLRGKKCHQIIHGTDQSPDHCPLDKMLRSGKLETYEMQIETATGVFLVSCTPVLDEEGRIEKVIHISTDITEHKRVEEAIRESEERFRSLIHNSLDLILIIDQNGKIAYETPSVENILGYPRGYIIGKSPLDFVHPEDLGLATRRLSEIYQKTNPGIMTEFRLRKADGTWVPVEGIGANLIDYPGINGIVITGRDITERKRAEAEKKKVETQLANTQKIESIGTFAGGIAHDFNNILSAIIGYAELAMNELSNPLKVENDLKGVLKAGNRAKELIAEIITFSRHGETTCEPTMLNSTINDSFKLLRSIIPTSVEIRQKHLSPGLVMADPAQIRRVIMNLCSNAAQAMGQIGGVLEISLEKVNFAVDDEVPDPYLTPGSYLRLTIGDTGHGMTPEVRERIFDPYFTTKEQGKGSGLGLSVVRGIVKKHRGIITCMSKPGEGTTFDIYFPEIESGGGQFECLEDVEPTMTTTYSTGSERILFIDDDSTLGYLAHELLGNLGYKVTTKTSSIEALALFKEAPDKFDMVITDMTMPVMTGDRLAQKILEIRRDIPIILCTGYSEYISKEKAESMGIHEFIMKPFEMKEMAKTIRRVLDKGQ